jgi:hypothetical protein
MKKMKEIKCGGNVSAFNPGIFLPVKHAEKELK